MNLQQLTDTINKLFYNDTTSYKTIMSIQSEMLTIVGAGVSIKAINSKVINRYIEKLKAKGNKPATINNKLMYLSKALSYAFRNQLIDFKPYIPVFKIQSKKDVIILPAEYQQMLDYCTKYELNELYKIIVIGHNTGMRISNILNLTKNDIDNGYIRIYQNKTNKPYSIPMNDKLKEVLKDFNKFNMNYRQVEYQFKKMIKELNLNNQITIHTLRHTTCTKLITSGVPIPVVQQLMNHKNINTTMKYTHIKNEQLELAVMNL